ncbi:MAG: rhomboid family intramembrane serine protease [Oscillospiraceae bacterium]
MTKQKYKLSYNSPVILTFAGICLVFLIIDMITSGWFHKMFLVCYGHPSLLDPLTYVRTLLYIFGHSGVQHFANNMIMLLLVGPVVEEKYGSWNTAVMILITGLASGILNSIFFSSGVIGASGIVFLMIILSAFTNMKRGEIPLSLILVSAIYLGQEVWNAIAYPNDGISQFGHIMGGLFGLGFGIYYHFKKFNGNY